MRKTFLIAAILINLLFISNFLSLSYAEEENSGGLGLIVAQLLDPESESRIGPLIVTGIIAGTPAEEQGIEKGDIITNIDEEETKGKNFDDLVNNKLRGPIGSTVELTIKRGMDEEPRIFKLTRVEMMYPAVLIKTVDPKLFQTAEEKIIQKEKILAAVNASNDWLIFVDGGNYSESWTNASEYFRNYINKEQWQQTISTVRDPFGKVESRKLKSKEYSTQMPGAPDGEYVVIQYSTSFEYKKSSVETVTVMLEKDGNWRIAGYFIN